MLMKPDQLVVERGLPIIHALHVAKRGRQTQLNTKGPDVRPLKTHHTV